MFPKQQDAVKFGPDGKPRWPADLTCDHEWTFPPDWDDRPGTANSDINIFRPYVCAHCGALKYSE